MQNKHLCTKTFLRILALFVALLCWPANTVITTITAQSVALQSEEQITTPTIGPSVAAELEGEILAISTDDDVQISSYDGFAIEIPKIALFKDIETHVDPTNPQVYLPVIDEKVAHGLTTSLPGQTGGNTYLFAHSKEHYEASTPDKGWFTRIDELGIGDVIFLHYNGRIFKYTVKEAFIVDPSAVEVYTSTSPYSTYSLTLQTCYPRGTTEKRLIVRAMGE